MEVTVIEKHSSERRGPTLLSLSCPSPRELRYIAAEVNQEEDTCKHFTIRGYVAGVRKRDAKICWPFVVSNHHKSDKYANLLPPIPEAKFRRWDCGNCLDKTTELEAVVENEALSNSHNDEAEEFSTSLHGKTSAGEKILFHDVKEHLEEKLIDGELAEADSSINSVNDECPPSISLAKESVISDVTEEGYQILKVRNDSCEESQDPSSDKPVSVATEGPACEMMKGDKYMVLQTTYTSGTAHIEDVQDKSKETEFVYEIVDSEMGLVPTAVGKNVASSAEMHNDVNGLVCKVDSMGLDEISYEASGSDVGLTEYTVECQHHDQKVSASDGKVQHKKSRKVRFLDDIIKSELLDVKSKNAPISNRDAESRHTANDINRRPDVCEGKEEHLLHVSLLSVQETKIEPIKNKEQSNALEGGDEGPSLMCWLQKVAKNALIHKRGAELKHNDSVAVSSKSAVDASSRREINITHKVSGNRGNKSKSFAHKKPDQMPWIYLNPQHETMATKGLVNAEDVANSKNHATTNCFDLRGKGVTRKSWHQGPNIQDSCYIKDFMSKKKRKTLEVEGEEFSQMHLSKDSFGKHDLANISDSQGEKKVTKKRRTTRVRRKGALDDIPMDIVELLAKNRQERLLMDAKASTDAIHDLSEKTQNMGNIFATTTSNRDMVLDAAWKDLSQQKAVSSGVLNGLGSNTEANGRLNDDISSNSKQSHYMESNQQDLSNASRGLLALPQSRGLPMSYTHPSKFDPKSNCTAKSYSSRMRMLTPESYLEDKALSGQNMCRNGHVWSPVLSTSTSFRVYSPICTENSNYVDILHHDSLPQRKVETAAHITAALKLVSPDGTRLLNGKEAEPVTDKRTFPAVTLADNAKLLYQDGNILLNEKEQNESSFGKRDPQDFTYAKVRNVFYPNEIIPATHLLRLMDPATQSGSSIHNPLDMNEKGFIQLSDFCANKQSRELVDLNEISKNSLTIKHPLMVKQCDQDQHQESSCKPVRPLPRFGVLGTLLQKEIAACSNNCGTQLGFKIGQCNESVTCETNWKMKSLCSTSNVASHAGVMNTKVPISSYENNTWTSGSVNVITHPDSSWVRNAATQVNQKAEAAFQPLKSISRTETCTVNRNPADFAIVNEDNEYMIPNQDLRYRHTISFKNLSSQNHIERKKRRKVMKLTTPIGLVRS